MQNPIFNLAKTFENQGGQNPNMMGNSMNPGMNNGMGGSMNMMNPMMNNNMNMMNQMQASGMNPMNNMNMMNQMQASGMNPMNNMNMMNNMKMNMNMNNMNNMANMNNMGNQQPQQNSQFINVYFRAGAQGENGSIMIQCTLNDRVSDLINKYKTKSLEDVSKKKFIFNAKALNPSLTVAEAGLQEGANIFVVNTAGVKGA